MHNITETSTNNIAGLEHSGISPVPSSVKFSRWRVVEFPETSPPDGVNIVNDRIEQYILERVCAITEKLARSIEMADLGCGDGSLAARILAEHIVKKFHLIDCSPGMLFQASMLSGHRANIVEHNLGDPLPFDSASLDVVIMKWVSLHLSPKDLLKCLKEAARVLQPGGFFILADSCACYPQDSFSSNAEFDSEPIVFIRGSQISLTFNHPDKLIRSTLSEIGFWSPECKLFSVPDDVDTQRFFGLQPGGNVAQILTCQKAYRYAF